jgi:SH3-like domain-containing protein
MTTRRVIADWMASYPDPIEVSAGDPITLDGREEIWDGHRWLWARNRDGKEGWIPDSLVARGETTMTAEDYTARELSCGKGQLLTVLGATHGWTFCENADGDRGWVPDRNLGDAIDF